MNDVNELFKNAQKYTRCPSKDKLVKKAIALMTDKTVTLCGSTDYKYEYERINRLLTLAGNVVLSCGVFRHDFSQIEDYRETLERVHKKKIDMSELIFVINVDNHIGVHTAAEISYATKMKKEIRYLYEDGEKTL